ncbi:cation diffusion facilitator family transporter [Sinomicrobium weinanense]|uniref:Cation transporter n=1 Tax=Sinomicrobium weinanense TaxID=2842200 RepID=A0A926PZU9_9FLAO|nr:cation diffusion facilitator family transporter [Sinomicrobium weinanense]MBC9794348.1 cation transporter [Sinomicrobium weinanense]MBU3124255.1 cation diffusion facilitator family transporter [Sinomicrobium weinanense]
MTREETAVKTIYFSILSNAVLAVVKGVTGIFGNSYALIADAIESTTDVFSSLLVLLGLKYANRPADHNHPYGHGKVEPLLTFVIVGFLVISATIIAYESIQNIDTPHGLPEPYTLIVLGVIILWKEISFRRVIKRSKETGSSSLKADAWHHRSDAITSVAAFIGISAALVLGEGYESADDWAALFASGIIVYNSYLIFRPALGEVMDEQLYEDRIKQVREIAGKVNGIMATEKCYVRKTGMKYNIDLHAIVNAEITVREGHKLAHDLKDAIREAMPDTEHILIHVEPYEENLNSV